MPVAELLNDNEKDETVKKIHQRKYPHTQKKNHRN